MNLWQRVGLLLLAAFLAACQPTTIQPTWEESFETAGHWQLSADAAAEVEIADGRLTILIRQPQQIAWALADYDCGDCTVSVEATALEGPLDNEFGLLLRADDDHAFYAFGISSDGYVHAARYKAGQWTPLRDWTESRCVEQGLGATNLLSLTAQGADFTLRVNDCEALTLHDEALTEGRIGLYAGAFGEAGVRVAFDNLHAGPVVP